MSAHVKWSSIASLVLLLVGSAFPLAWHIYFDGGADFREFPESVAIAIPTMEDKDRLRKLATMLVESNTEFKDDAVDMLTSAINLIFLISILGVLFIWCSTLACIKESRKANGQPLGWLRWI